MRRTFGLALAVITAAFVVSGISTAASATSPSTAFTFNLVGPNTAVGTSAPFVGDPITIRGAGAFDTAAGTITASGAFTHVSVAGVVIPAGVVTPGVWKATRFVSFQSFGGPNPGLQGGVLQFEATLFEFGIAVATGVPMSVTCLINAPAGFTGEEGTTLGVFDEKIDGETLFHRAS
jgi:hypothetical protein